MQDISTETNRPGRILIKLLVTSFCAALLFVFDYFPALVESWYANGLYRLTSMIQRFISSLFPFAIGDFLYAALGLYILLRIYRFGRKLIKKELKRSALWTIPMQIAQFLLLLYIIFKLSWGLNYSRQPIAASLGISNAKYTQTELLSLGNFLIAKVNALQPKRAKNPGWSIYELQQEASVSYKNVSRQHAFFRYYAPAVKPVLNSMIITRLGIEGYYNPLSGEANVNMQLPVTSLPFVSCHEIAHQLGIGREDEANLIGYLAAIHSNNLEFRYSGYYAMLRSVLVEIGKSMPEIYSAIYYTVNKRTISEFERDQAFWLKYNSQMYGYMDMTFDKFLKLNDQAKGTDSYQDIVLWLYNYHKKEL
jgi:hypothetical protein